MSVLSYQLNQVCNTNPDLLMCKTLNAVAPVVVVIFTVLLPIVAYSLIKQESFRKGDWTKKLAYLSLLSFMGTFLIGLTLQILKYISDSVPIFMYSIYSAVGILPMLYKHPEILAKMYPKDSAEINSWSTTQKNIAAICVLVLIFSFIYLFLNK